MSHPADEFASRGGPRRAARPGPAAARNRFARRAAAREIVLMMLALALLGLTGWMLTAPDQPALPEGGPTLSFFCEACQKPFELTAREVELATRSGAGGDPRSGLSGGFPCKHCQQRRGIRNLPAPETPAAVP